MTLPGLPEVLDTNIPLGIGNANIFVVVQQIC